MLARWSRSAKTRGRHSSQRIVVARVFVEEIQSEYRLNAAMSRVCATAKRGRFTPRIRSDLPDIRSST